MEFRLRVQPDGSLSAGTERTEYYLNEKLKQFAGRDVNCQVDTRETPEKRRFFEGPITAYWFYQNPKSGWRNMQEARDNLKLRWNARDTFMADGSPVRIPMSTKITNKRFADMLLQIQHDWDEEGYEFPDPEAFKEWEATDPSIGAEYPPVLRLKEKYLKNF